PAGRGRADAADLFFAAMVQSVGPGGGGGAIRFGGDAPLCRDRSRPRTGSRRDHGVPLPPPARGARCGPAAVRRGAAALGGQETEGGHRHNRRCNHHQCTLLDQECRKARDPEMHQTKKGNQWYFGMKAHFGVDSRTKLIHAVAATPANVADSTVLPELLHGRETRVWGDQAYRGQRAGIRERAPKARDFTNRRYRHRGVVDEVERAKNRTKSKVRARVEHAIGVIKRVFGFAKVRYRGLNKNLHRLLVTCALANLFMARRHL